MSIQDQKLDNISERPSDRRKDIPDGLWTKCPECNEIIYNGELDRSGRICRRCNYYFPFEPAERIAFLVDEGSFRRYKDVRCPNKKTCDQAIVTGRATLSGYNVIIMAVNLNFTELPVGLFVCKKIVRAINHAIEQRLPLLSICTGGIGKQNGVFFPAQTLSINLSLKKLEMERLAYISVLSQCGPYISFPGFVYIADVVIAESNMPGASFTGSRIGRREAEWAVWTLFQNGLVDMIVPRGELKQKLTDILGFFY